MEAGCPAVAGTVAGIVAVVVHGTVVVLREDDIRSEEPRWVLSVGAGCDSGSEQVGRASGTVFLGRQPVVFQKI